MRRLLPKFVLLLCALLSISDGVRCVLASDGAEVPARAPRVAAVVTVYRPNSHAEMLVGRIVKGELLDNNSPTPKLNLVSIYVDQHPERDLSNELTKFGVRLSPTIADALTLGTGKLAVDAVMLVAEHGQYPESESGQTVYPKRRFFDEILTVCETSGRVVPLFCDKHLADNWADAKAIYDKASQLKMPLMAGSSVPGAWRRPSVDVPRRAKLKQIVAVSYGSLDAYGFHGLEAVQALAEQRADGETGVAAVQCLTGNAVWDADANGVFDRRLLEALLPRLTYRKIDSVEQLKTLTREPVLFVVDYRDGLRANLFTLNGAVGDWAAAWSVADSDKIESTAFVIQNQRPYLHFALQLRGIEQMFQTGQPAWPVERTLLTSGLLDELLLSKKDRGMRRTTPHLAVSYQPAWRWHEPALPAPVAR